MDRFKIVLKIIAPLFLGLFLIASISIYSLYMLQKQNIDKKAKEAFETVSLALNQITKKDIDLMYGLLDIIKKDPKMIALYKDGKRDNLYAYLYQSFSEYKSHYNITHFYIHNVDKTNFLRVHDRYIHSDIIKRKTLSSAAEELKMSSGVEFGIYHNLTLRVVVPWIVDGELIGYLEFGREIDSLTPELSKILSADIIFTIKKELITMKDFEIWKSKSQRNRYYKAMDNFFIIDSTLNDIDIELQKILNTNENFNDTHIVNHGKEYHINNRPYLDMNGTEVGKLYVLIDTSDEHTYLVQLIGKITVIVFLLIFLLIVYYARYIKKTENKLNLAYEKLHEISITDGLTSLYNRKFYIENSYVQIKRALRNNLYVTFIMIDADNFKNFNDKYGHSEGDEVLKSIANSMKNVFQRANDYCYRVGGEEFVVIMEHEKYDDGYEMAQKLCEDIENLNITHAYNATFNKVTVSIGISTIKVDELTNSIDLYNNADKALYLSKENGRNRVTLYENN
ncbi:MAG: diguanylate cyclase [Sulfurimonas sp.]